MQTETTATLTRRHAFKWMGLTGAALALGGRRAIAQDAPVAPAAVPAGGDVHGAGFYRTKVGTFDVTVLSDGSFPLGPAGQTFGLNADPGAVDAALAEAFIPADKVFVHVNALLIRGEGATLLVDTGVGRLMGPVTGQLLNNLARAGHRPEEVTHILFTHLHPDHVGGALDAKGQPVFPKASVYYHKAEAAFWTSPHPDFSKSSVAPQMQQMMVEQARKTIDAFRDRSTALEGERAAVVPGVTLIHTPGHTPGHVAVEIDSQGERLISLGDLAHHSAISFPHPLWHVAFDTDREAAAAMRKSFYATLANDRTLVTGPHMPFPALGHLRKRAEADSYDWVPVQWMW